MQMQFTEKTLIHHASTTALIQIVLINLHTSGTLVPFNRILKQCNISSQFGIAAVESCRPTRVSTISLCWKSTKRNRRRHDRNALIASHLESASLAWRLESTQVSGRRNRGGGVVPSQKSPNFQKISNYVCTIANASVANTKILQKPKITLDLQTNPRPNSLTVLLRSDWDGRRGGALSALRSRRQPHVVQRVRIEAGQSVGFGYRYAAVVLLLGVGVIPVELVIDDVFPGMRRFAPLQGDGGLADIRRHEVARLARHACGIIVLMPECRRDFKIHCLLKAPHDIISNLL